MGPETQRARTGAVDERDLSELLTVLANPTRLALIERLAKPAFVTDLAQEMGLTRQSLERHLQDLEAAGFVVGTPSWRGPLRATEYATDRTALFTFTERLGDLGKQMAPVGQSNNATLPSAPFAADPQRGHAGLLLVHGDTPGKWFSLQGKRLVVIGRSQEVDVSVPYDAFSSSRHASLHLANDGWRLTDLKATNPPSVNFRPLQAGESVLLRHGDLITVGRTQLLFRIGY
ncbi:MAG TPA: FHA domain-containing protein [Candidatus Thermoplasmatota archaeon]|nr:FHA domain-containing protein [Candidatus Thermoplasmatota archaeon]